MKVMTIFVFVLIGTLIHLLFLYLRNKVLQKSASYKLHAVRDELFLLVVKDKLEKEGKIYQYYNSQAKKLLKLFPDVGIDDAKATFLLLNENEDFDQSLKEAAQRAEEMLELVQKKSKGVSDVIADYYAASKNLMLVHSTALRLLYPIKIKYQLPELVNRLIPEAIRAGIKTVKFADTEEARFRKVTYKARSA